MACVLAGCGGSGDESVVIGLNVESTGEVPSDVGALTWDAMRLVIQAIENCGDLTGDLAADRACVRDGMASIAEFEGITGTMSFDNQGDPTKCMVIATIDGGTARFYKSVCP